MSCFYFVLLLKKKKVWTGHDHFIMLLDHAVCLLYMLNNNAYLQSEKPTGNNNAYLNIGKYILRCHDDTN